MWRLNPSLSKEMGTDGTGRGGGGDVTGGEYINGTNRVWYGAYMGAMYGLAELLVLAGRITYRLIVANRHVHRKHDAATKKALLSLFHKRIFFVAVCNSSMPFFDCIYYINLDRRKDRYDEITRELATYNLSRNNVSRISAADMRHDPRRGCALSHIRVLREFIASPFDNALILEDDIMFTRDPRPAVAQFLQNVDDWCIVMLASNTTCEVPFTSFATKILTALTCSAYAITKSFAPVLLDLWTHVYDNAMEPCDLSWQRLQAVSNWYCLKPIVAIQRPSYSDIERRNVAYGV